MANAMMVIDAYRDTLGWAFDDDSRELKREAFVMGSSQLIDQCIKLTGSNPKDVEKVTLLFSANPFPEYQLHVIAIGTEHGGMWYRLDKDNEGWLCPATLKYFPEFPDDIYLKVIV